MITFLNHKTHPEDKSKKYFFYKDIRAFNEMKKLLDEKSISYIEHEDTAPTYYIVLDKDLYDEAQHYNALALSKFKQKLIPDKFARFFLIGLLAIAFVFALIGYIKQTYFS